MKTLGDVLPKQIERCKDLIKQYDALPNGVGAFGKAMIQQAIGRAEKANAEQDCIAMLQSLHELENCK